MGRIHLHVFEPQGWDERGDQGRGKQAERWMTGIVEGGSKKKGRKGAERGEEWGDSVITTEELHLTVAPLHRAPSRARLCLRRAQVT